MMWDPRLDCFTFHISPFSDRVTKGTILSYIAKIYDPMGFLAPAIFYMKWFLQQLWLVKVDWDDELSVDVRNPWLEFVGEHSSIPGIL